jgi:hypothetical protein
MGNTHGVQAHTDIGNKGAGDARTADQRTADRKIARIDDRRSTHTAAARDVMSDPYEGDPVVVSDDLSCAGAGTTDKRTADDHACAFSLRR